MKNNNPKRQILRRGVLFLLAITIGFTATQPMNVMALVNINQKVQPKNPSVLPAEKVDIAKQQATFDTTSTPVSTSKKEDRTRVREDISKRTPFTSTYVNRDGTKTLSYSIDQQNFKRGKDWLKIDNKLEAVDKPVVQKNLFDVITNTAQKTDSPIAFRGKAGNASTQMKSLSEGVSIDVAGKTITMKPMGARNVTPVRKDDRTVAYKDAWPNVDLEYELRGESVKEIIVIKNKSAASTFNFKVSGGKVVNHPTRTGELTIEGMPAEFSFSSLTLDVNEQGVISEQRVTQKPSSDGIKVEMDKAWMQSQPAKSFPMRIDPSFGRYATSYWMFKSDGYACGSSNCYANIGTLDNVGWKHWRSYIQFPYSELAGKKILNANLHGWFKYGINGIGDGRWIGMGHAPCISFHCQGGQVGSAYVGTDFDINFTGGLSNAVNAGDYGAVWSLWGEEGPYKSYKPYYNMYADIIYDTPTPIATPVEPADKQVTINTQPTLRVNPVGDADGDAVRYYYRVSTSPDAETGAVINSGWIPSTQWTVPDGILQDGTTYYWHVYTLGATQTNPNWVRSFKVDLRTGKDSTQSYDTVGPIGVDLATGNATTSTGTHSMNAAGGSIGLGLNYDSPVKTSKGLTGEYWNVSSSHAFGSTPGGAPVLTRNDQDVNFSFTTGSPGAGINSDWFYARWKGYFVAPTTGSYMFGASNDDAISINVNGQTFGGCYGSTPCYGTNSITLQAGQTVPITIDYQEATGDAYARVYVKGAVPEQTLPRDWLQTEVKAVSSQYGLNGRYYTDDGTHNFPTDNSDPMRLMMARTDSKLSFNWGLGAPAPGLQTDNFMSRWTGYVTVPTTGAYTFGAVSDDGVRIKLNNGFLGASQTVLNAWQDQAALVWGSSTNLTAGQQVPITVEYFEHGGGAQINLQIRGPNVADQDIPVKWLTPKASALPDAWRLGVDVDGDVGYERLRVAGNNIVLEDSTRATHEYTWTGSGYKPPVNEDGLLTRNSDNTYTLLDTDGRTYIFDAEGKLKSLTSASDDRQPSSLKYEYAGDPSRLMKITDGVTSSRFGTLHYKNVNEDGNCSVPGGFDTAPDGMLCAFKTSDGDMTKLYYKAGQLSRIEKPGNDLTDYGYDGLGRIVSTRDSIANDVITASVRADDATVLTEISYDQIGRASAVKAPAATATASRINHTFDYLGSGSMPLYRYNSSQDHMTSISVNPPGYYLETKLGSLLTSQVAGSHAIYSCKISYDEFTSTDSNCEGQVKLGLLGYAYDTAQTSVPTVALYRCTVLGSWEHFTSLAPNCEGQNNEGIKGYIISNSNFAGATQMHITGAPEPNGFSKRVEYDSLLRTSKETDVSNLSSVQEWDSVKDLQLSSTDATGLKSTTIYDSVDRPVDSYGPAPSTWYGTDRRPLAAYAQQVPRTQTGYDEGIRGLSIAAYNNKKMNGTPKLYKTGFNNVPYASYGLDLAAGEVTPTDGASIRVTGKVLLNEIGNHSFRAWHTDGMRIYIDNQIVVDDWVDGGERFSANRTFNNTIANRWVDFRMDVYRTGTVGRVFAQLFKTSPGAAEQQDISGLLTPAYNLTTSQTAYDAQLGNVTTTTSYSRPEYGLVDKATLDPTGLNLQSSSTYETPGTGFLRQTSKTLPGGGTTNYQHYSATDTRDNPCTVAVEAFHQAGLPKGKVEADPDGAGPQTGRSSETIYNESGEVVATRYNNDSWTCTTYDARGRILQTILPARGDKQGRTISNNYLTDNNPLITTTTDNSGTIRIENDLLGRTIKYTDTRGKLTTNTYDAFGKLASRTSPIGVESYEYDNYDRMTKQKLDGVTFATIAYDQFGRIGNVQYPAGISLSSLTRDQLGRENSDTFSLAGGQTLTDQITRATSGDIISGTENGVNKQYTYDNVGRLTNATLGSNSYAYEFGTLSPDCGVLPGNNPNAGKNGNRTKMTANGQVTTYCYDMADRLITSSDNRLSNSAYDDHGNTIRLGSDSQKTEFGYDASDRNTIIKETLAANTGSNTTNSTQTKQIYYERDAQSRVTRREAKTNDAVTNDTYYGFTSAGDTPDVLMDSSGNVIQKYVTLPGDVIATIKTGSTSAGATTYSLPNVHGDVFATVNADGSLISTFINGPFGEQIAGQTDPGNTVAGATWSYVGQNQKLTESGLSLEPTQMGARVYIGQIGRFMQVDPVEGGTDNNYVYANDPVNEFDLGGNIVETVADVAGIGYDSYQMLKNPSWGNAGMLTWSVAAVFIPFVPGSYAGRAGVATFKAAKGAVPVMTKKEQYKHQRK